MHQDSVSGFGRTTARLTLGMLAVAAVACGAGLPGDPKARAAEIVRAAGASGGLCVHLGCGDGRLTAELSSGGRFLVHGLDRERAAVEKARTLLRERGLYGQVWAERYDAARLPYAEHLVNLLVAEDLPRTGVPLAEVMRVLCPGGVAWVGGKALRKPWPKEMDEWGHPRHGPDGNAASGDRLVGPPRRVRWVAGPMHEVSNMVTAGGRLFYAGLIARDAFNGLRLWETGLEPTPMRLGYPATAMPGSVVPVAAGGRVYVVTHKRLQALDAATGRPVRSYPEAGTPRAILCDDGVLIAADASSVKALDAQSGKLLWAHAAQEPGGLVAGGGGVFLLQGSVRRGGTRAIVKLDRGSGKPRWEREGYPWAAKVRRTSHHGGLLVCEVSTLNNDRPGNGIRVLADADGSVLWQRDYQPGMSHYMQARAMHVGGLVWVLHKRSWEALDARDGTVKKTLPALAAHCYPPVATPRFLLAGEMGFTDIATGLTDAHRMTKGACGRDAGFIPANGLLYCAPKHCACYPMLQGYVAMAPAAAAAAPGLRLALERGPALGAVAPSATQAAPDEWPCYRADPWRSGSSAAAVPASLDVLWTAELGGWPRGPLVRDWRENPFVRGPLTPPVVAGGLAVVARPDAHQVVALDARTGKRRWDFTANGRVDTPPTLFAGLCLFGTRSGWVTCLRASDGAVAWRLRAAASEERIVSFGQLESPWPVPGSVLVVDGVAYAAAGRHPLADGGILVLAVNPQSGQVAWAKRIASLPMTNFYGGAGLEFDPFDLLVTEDRRAAPADGPGFITLSRWRIDRGTGEVGVAWKSGFACYRTGGAGVMAPRGLWTYGPRMDYIPSGPKPGKPDYVHSAPRPLMVFRDSMLIGSSDGQRRLFRRDFTAAQVAAFADTWFNQRHVPRRRGQKGARNRSERLSAGAAWSIDAFTSGPGGQGIGAMALAADTVFVAGKAGRLLALAASDGRKLAERELPAPVWDGLAAAYGRLYVATRDGRLLCLASK